MGSIYGTEIPKDDNEIYYKYDDFTKKQIVEYAKSLSPKGLQIENDFADRLKNLDLVCTGLFAMNIEFYDKAKKVIPEITSYTNDSIKDKVQKVYFVKPKFGPDAAKTDSSRAHIDVSTFGKLELDIKPEPKILCKIDKITLIEYVETFRNPTNSKDLFGISKKVLMAIPNFHKQRFINIYNKLFDGKLPIKNISLGRAAYIYKDAKRGPTDEISSFRQIIAIPNSISHYHRILALSHSPILG